MQDLGFSLAQLGQRAHAAVLDAVPLDALLETADRMLDLASSSGRSPHAICESVAEAMSRRMKGRREQVGVWLDAHRGRDTPGHVWVRARLRTWLGDTAAALEAWDCVIERGLGHRPARYLARARLRLDAGDAGGACQDLREAFRDPAAYEDMQRGVRLLRRIPAEDRPAVRSLRIGLLGSHTTQLITPLLELVCFRDGIRASVYEGEYGAVHQEILDPSSGLRRFEPDVVILATGGRIDLNAFHPDPDTAVEELVAPLRDLWAVCRSELRSHVLQHNFELPGIESAGHLSRALPGGRGRLLMRANLALLEAAGPGVTIVDTDAVAAEAGRAQWEDPGLWYLAKQHPASSSLPLLLDRYAAHLRAIVGLTRKVLVLDLDNTLWGGVVGEDGVHGLHLGAHSADGEAYSAVQRYALELKQRGIVLAICSKNNEADAREPFEKHPEMVLGLDDFAVFRANWEDKASNLREIARRLDLGLESFVFLDDNPTERAWVRSQLPEVAVPEIGEDPSFFLSRLQRYHYFDTLTLTDEDRLRAEDYAANVRRSELQERTGGLTEFLQTLDMTATVGTWDGANLPRIAQLVNKTNQFNLTTRRYTEDQLRSFAASPEWVTRWFRLRDRFGDNGLIGVLLARLVGSATAEIDLWLMSCRVLGRRMEEFMLAELVEAARAAGVRRLVGWYLPTAKNGMVRELYARLGFRLVQGLEGEGPTEWELAVEDAPEPSGASLIRREDSR